MSWTVTWSPVSDRDVLHMHYTTAERICAAVYTFARSGSGTIERVDPDGRSGRTFIVIRAGGGFAVVEIGADRLHVWRLHSTEPSNRRPLLGDPPAVPPSPEPPPAI